MFKFVKQALENRHRVPSVEKKGALCFCSPQYLQNSSGASKLSLRSIHKKASNCYKVFGPDHWNIKHQW